MKKLIKSSKIGIALLTFTIGLCFCKSVYASDEINITARPISEKYIQWTETSEEERKYTIEPRTYTKNIEDSNFNGYEYRAITRSLGASSKYNLRDSINLKIKDQMDTEQCWAFATTTQLESYMAKINRKNVEYSARHIEYSTTKTFADGVNSNGYNRELNSGGNFYISYGYLTSGQGPILEADMPFENTTKKINLSEIQNKTVQAQLKEYKIFPSVYKEKNGSNITYYNGESGTERLTYTRSADN